MGYTLKEVFKNINELSYRSRCKFELNGSSHDIDIPYVLFLAGLKNNSYLKSAFLCGKPSDNNIEKLINYGFLELNDSEIKVSDKAKDARYVFYCKVNN